ncbi:serine/threonine-protein phosphatase PPG1 [Nematocida ausubeli]|nr:serine/threonine-protein phosphatase PPG1 [Nematocida ausubeli]
MTVQPPASAFWKNEEAFINKLSNGELTNSDIFEICRQAIEIFVEEPFMLELSSEIVVVGDIHGQFFDLLNILKVPSDKYLFLGDFVDRGANSVETIVLLLYMKIKHPDSVWLLRGNHESLKTSSGYGFKTECMQVYRSKMIWHCICEVFDYLPVCAIIDRKVFAVHAGIGPDLDLETVQMMPRVGDIPTSGTIADLVWSDPNEEAEEFMKSARGVGYYFGEKQTDEFLKKTGLERIIRSHQLVDEGYKEDFGGKVITIWSAPNYCYRCMNKAAVARIIDGNIAEYIEIVEAEYQRKETKVLSYFL